MGQALALGPFNGLMFTSRLGDRGKLSRVSNQNGVSLLKGSRQNGVSLLYIMLEIHHSGREPSEYSLLFLVQSYY